MAVVKIKDANGNWQNVVALKGDKGEDGADGITPNLTVQVETLAAGSNATVTQSGTTESPVIKLGIPRGNTGATGANGKDADTSTLVLRSGSRGTLAGYNTPASSSAAITINASSNDDTIVTAAVAVTVSNGSSGQTWTKTVALQNASATVTLGSSWKWVGGSAPTIKAKSILVVKWCGTFGLANLVAGE